MRIEAELTGEVSVSLNVNAVADGERGAGVVVIGADDDVTDVYPDGLPADTLVFRLPS